MAAVMADAGLTNRAIYAPFTSKEDLVANVLADQLRARGVETAVRLLDERA